jgi:hypothetical protein
LPILYLGIPNPTLFRWNWVHDKAPVPTDVKRRADKFDRIAPFISEGMLAAALWWIFFRQPLFGFKALGLTTENVGSASLGIIGGVVWLGL